MNISFVLLFTWLDVCGKKKRSISQKKSPYNTILETVCIKISLVLGLTVWSEMNLTSVFEILQKKEKEKKKKGGGGGGGAGGLQKTTTDNNPFCFFASWALFVSLAN